MKEDLARCPFYAVKSKLADVEPLDGTTNWPQNVKEKFAK